MVLTWIEYNFYPQKRHRLLGLQRILKIIDFTSIWSGKLFSSIAWAMLLIIPYEVVARYFLNAPTIWANELVTYLCGIYAVIGGAYTLQLESHVTVDLVYSRWSSRTKTIVEIIFFPLFAIYFSVVLWTGSAMFWDALAMGETSGTAWNPPISLFRFAIPVAAALMLLQGIGKLLRKVIFLRQPHG